MILINLIGGLGNQMFQYAAGRALSLHLDSTLRLDVSAFADYKVHQGFELPLVFGCQANIATEQDVARLLGWQSPKIIRQALARPQFKFMRRKNYIVEPHFNYWQGIKQVPDHTYLAGYWQSEKYFQDMADVIHSDFTFNPKISSPNNEVATHIKQANAVSLHVRRGDYIKNPKTNATHGLCSLDYYRSAIHYIAGRIDHPDFFVFSDDMAWVKDNLKIDFPCQYIDHNYGAESYNDMRLMSMCKHHIIANSSFSWWGAWLGCEPEKIVIAPRQWFVNSADTSDLLPESWIAL